MYTADDCYKALVFVLLAWCVVNTGFIIAARPGRQSAKTTDQSKAVVSDPAPMTLAEEAAYLRKQFDSVHVYAVSNGYEVWCTEGIYPGLWKTTNSLAAARAIVDEYYIEWANNVMGKPRVAGRLIE